jgi:glutamate synthase (NADPH/NADH) small chain
LADLQTQRSEIAFPDGKPAYTPDQATTEAARCFYCHDAPCMHACPTHIDIAGFIRKIHTGNVKGAARTILDANILGMSCSRVCPVEVLCVGACVYNEKDVAPIQIGKLQRYATDAALAHGWRYFAAGPESGRRVACVGAGPASLACAHELRRLGHAVTILEKRDVIGGLNTTGVAPYKLRGDESLKEIDYLLGIGGISVQTGVAVDAELLGRLVADYDAVFVGIGLGPDSRLGIPGEDLPGVRGAVDWIEQMKTGTVDVSAVTHAAVLGGGNTALDCVRELRGLGVPCVRLLYRGDEASMSGYAHEWEHAKIEGVEAVWSAQPIAIEGNGQVASVRCAVTGPDKRPIPGRTFVLDAELVLLAVGQAKIGALVERIADVRVERGRIVADAEGRTGHAKLFAGGDCVNGGKEVVNAVAEGKVAARAIHRALEASANG